MQLCVKFDKNHVFFLHSVLRKEKVYDDVQYPDEYVNDHVYGNMGVRKAFLNHSLFPRMKEESELILLFPIQIDCDDAIYGNM